MEAEGMADVEKLNLFFPGEVVQAIQEVRVRGVGEQRCGRVLGEGEGDGM